MSEERIKSQAMIAAGNAINQAGMNNQKLKSQRIQKGGEILGKALEKHADLKHQKEQQSSSQFHQQGLAAMQKEQPTKETKEWPNTNT